MRHTFLVTALATVLATTLALPAMAGGPPPPKVPGTSPPAGELAGRREEMRNRVQEKIQVFLTTELTTRVGLDATKSARLSEAIKAHMGRKRERQQALHEAMQKLQGLIDAKAPDAQVKAQLDTVLGASSRDDDMQAFVADASKFLSVTEQAKLALALPDVLKDVHKMMKEARRGMRHGGPGGFGGPGGPGGDDEE